MKINWKKIEPATLLLITWDDIVSDCSWLADVKAQNYQPTHCKDIGWFINDDKLNVRISNSVNSDGEKSITVIPKGCVRFVQVIKYEKGDKK